MTRAAAAAEEGEASAMEDLREPLLAPPSPSTNHETGEDDEHDEELQRGNDHDDDEEEGEGAHDDENGVDHDDPAGAAGSRKGACLLVFVAFLYSTMNISLRTLYTLPVPPTPSDVNATRGGLILVFFLPLVLSRRRRRSDVAPPDPSASLGRVAFEMALYNFFAQAFFNFGLEQTSSPRASFLGQTTVVMVPLLSALAGHALTRWDGLGCLCSFCGLLLLSLGDGNDHEDNDPTESTNKIGSFLGVGDLMILAGAFCWSLYLIRMARFAHLFDEVRLQWTKNVHLAILYTVWFAASHWRDAATAGDRGWQHQWLAWAVLAYSAFGPGTLADVLQQKAQESVGPTESNLILCVESVFTAILGRLLLGEETSWTEKIGGAFLIAGAAVSGR